MKPFSSLIRPQNGRLDKAWPGIFTRDAHGIFTYRVYIPTGYRSDRPVPLVVLLHGCSQSPEEFALTTDMNTYAEQHTFLVLYPDQPQSSHMLKCWHWYEPAHQVRDKGEPARIVQMVQQMIHAYAIDTNRIYVAGLSAGAAMSCILGATYPDVFTAIGICSGVPYQAATTFAGTLPAMMQAQYDADMLGEAAFKAMDSHKRVVPVIVFHGTADMTVGHINADKVMAQWAYTNRLAANSLVESYSMPTKPTQTIYDSVPSGRSYTVYGYQDEHGIPVMEKYLVKGMRHTWSGGPKDASFTDPKGPKASAFLVEFFLQHTMSDIPVPAPTPAPVGVYAATLPLDQVATQPTMLTRIKRCVQDTGAKVMRFVRGIWKK